MRTRHTAVLPSPDSESSDFSGHASFAALRGCMRAQHPAAGRTYLSERLKPGASAAAIIGRIHRTLIDRPRVLQCLDLVAVLEQRGMRQSGRIGDRCRHPNRASAKPSSGSSRRWLFGRDAPTASRRSPTLL